MKAIIAFIFITLTAVAFAQDNKVVQAEFTVEGICNMCKSRIENALKIDEVRYVKWDKHSKILKTAFLYPAVSADSLQKRIAAVGHDTENHKAPKDVYKNLPGCCLYRDGVKTH